MQSNRDTSASVAKYEKATFDRIFENEQLRNAGMKAFYVGPSTYNSPPLAKGFGE